MLRKILLYTIIVLISAIISTVAIAQQGDELTPISTQISYDISSPGQTTFSSTGALIAWSNGVKKDSRIYYGLNSANVGNYASGQWSMWDNSTEPKVRLSGLKANTTYYYKIQTWQGGVPDNLQSVMSFTTLKPGTWTRSAETTVSPSGFINSPTNLRTINITVAPLDTNGRYIPGLSLTAVIYNFLGDQIDSVSLTGTGPYSATYTLPDFVSDGRYVIEVTGYPEIKGEFTVIRWGCSNCHTAGGMNNPSTFNPIVVHSGHIDTTDINIVHPAPIAGTRLYSTQDCGGPYSCHSEGLYRYPNWIDHPLAGSSTPNQADCAACHKPAGLTCENCHSDKSRNENALSDRYGVDAHNGKQTCNNCHGTLDAVNSQPSCKNCHPRSGKEYLTIPESISNKTHTSANTVECGLCHNSEHDIKSLTNDSTTCRNCHVGINHDGGSQCVACHGSDIHNVTSGGGEDCILCHGTGPGYPSPMARTTLVNISAFNESIHQNINASRDPAFRDNRTSNEDCWQCHYLKSMSRNEIRGCNYCHRNVPQWHGDANITTDWSHLW